MIFPVYLASEVSFLENTIGLNRADLQMPNVLHLAGVKCFR